MKTLVTKLVQMSAAVVFTLFAGQSNAQTITTPVKQASDLSVGGDYTKGTSTSTGTTLFCAENTGFKLKADPVDPLTGATYTGFTWEEQQSGAATFGAVANASGATNAATLTLTSATPGWHTYRVTATVTGNVCPPDPSYYTVYVLPKLKVTAESNKATAAEHTYCESAGAPAGSNEIKFTGIVAFDGIPNALPGLQALTISDFEIQYTWTKINNATAATTVVGNTKDYTVADPAASTATASAQYTYELSAAYTVKTCGSYKGNATLNGTTTTAVVTVTPKPGKPTITIE